VKIDNTLKTTATTKVKEAGSGKSRTTHRLTPDHGVHDEVELTGDAAVLRELENRLAALEITDPKKVESIRQAIADGTFKVDEWAVAEGLVNETVEQLRHSFKR